MLAANEGAGTKSGIGDREQKSGYREERRKQKNREIGRDADAWASCAALLNF